MEKVTIQRYIKEPANYDKTPSIELSDLSHMLCGGWESIKEELQSSLQSKASQKLIIETYHGVHHSELMPFFQNNFPQALFLQMTEAYYPPEQIEQIVAPFLGDHPVFGYLSDLEIDHFIDPDKLVELKDKIKDYQENELIIIYGTGASRLMATSDILVYADMPRWEIQQRFRKDQISNLGVSNKELKTSLQYKRSYFVDWRICDRIKCQLFEANRCSYFLDTTIRNEPKMITDFAWKSGLLKACTQPFRVVPFFDPGVWGGQWMKEVCDLNPDPVNYAWCFDCVPEENSLLLKFEDSIFELPSINLVFMHPKHLLGGHVYQKFGAEFPIRFDFLDTMDGGNLSLQVHPTSQYIKEQFGMSYTQDESYYLLAAEKDACVYLGVKENVQTDEMIKALEIAQAGGETFPAEKFVNKWPVKTHDHVLIPAGTIHCSGKNSMVLEISATPYIFTFKLWDWGRVDLDGLPRPISIDHGKKVIDWNKTTDTVKKELINAISHIAEGDGWREEKTGLHESEFIETRRHWFSKK